MSDANSRPNYRHGVRGAKIAIQTAPGVYGTPWVERGIESVEESAPSSNATDFHSEDTDTETVTGAGGNETLAVQFSEYSKKFNTDVRGHRIDAATGGILRSKEDVSKKFAFGYELQGTQRGVRIWKYGCSADEPVSGANQTDGENVTEAPETSNFTVGGDVFPAGSFDELVCHEGEPGYETFLDAVPIPSPGTPAVMDAKLSSLSVGTLVLTPAFNADTEAYVATTSNSSDVVTALAADDGATVTISVNGVEQASGDSATWVTGTNTVVVTVASDTASTTYIVVVTKE